jgi:EpsI family protein
MKNGLRRGIVIAVLMTASPILSWVLTPQKSIAHTTPPIDLESAIPIEFFGWKVDKGALALVPAADKQQVLDAIYNQIVNRTYVNERGERMMLSVAYGSTQSKELRAHRQEVCYEAQGFKIARLEKANLAINGAEIPATRMVAIHGHRSEPVTYWFTMGDHVVRSHFDREFVQLRYAASGYLPDGYLFRVSSISRETEHAFASQLEFARALIAASDQRLAAKLAGRPANRG